MRFAAHDFGKWKPNEQSCCRVSCGNETEISANDHRHPFRPGYQKRRRDIARSLGPDFQKDGVIQSTNFALCLRHGRGREAEQHIDCIERQQGFGDVDFDRFCFFEAKDCFAIQHDQAFAADPRQLNCNPFV